jgi:hypothetical protein
LAQAAAGRTARGAPGARTGSCAHWQPGDRGLARTAGGASLPGPQWAGTEPALSLPELETHTVVRHCASASPPAVQTRIRHRGPASAPSQEVDEELTPTSLPARRGPGARGSCQPERSSATSAQPEGHLLVTSDRLRSVFLRPDGSLQGNSGQRRALVAAQALWPYSTPSRVAPSLTLAGHSSRLRLGVGVRFVGLISIAGQWALQVATDNSSGRSTGPGPPNRT